MIIKYSIIPTKGTFCFTVVPKATIQRLQEELEGQQAMLAARQEREALLKAEVAKLAEENGRLKEEILEHQGMIMGLEEQVAEAGTASNVCLPPYTCIWDENMFFLCIVLASIFDNATL